MDALTFLTNASAGVIKQFTPLFDAFGQLLEQSDLTGEGVATAFGQLLAAATIVGEFGNKIGLAIAVVNTFATNVEGATDTILGALTVAKNGWEIIWDSFVAAANASGYEIANILATILPGELGDQWAASAAVLKTSYNDALQQLEMDTAEANAGTEKLTGGLEAIFGNPQRQAVDDAKKGLGEVGDAAKQGADATKEFEPIDLGNLDPVVEAATRLGASLTEAGSAAVAAENQFAEMLPGELGDQWAESSAKLKTSLGDAFTSLASDATEGDAAMQQLNDGIVGVFGSEQEQALDEAKNGLIDVGVEAKKSADATGEFEPIDLGNLDPVVEAATRLGASLTEAGSAAVAAENQFAEMLPGELGDQWAESSAKLKTSLGDAFTSLASDATEGDAAMQQLNDGIVGVFGSEQEQALDEAKNGLIDVGVEAKKSADATGEFEPIDLGDLNPVAEAARRLGVSLTDAGTAAGTVAENQAAANQEWATAEEKSAGFKRIVDELGNVTYVQVGGEIEKTNTALQKQQKEMEKSAEKAAEFQLKLEEIQSKERIAIIEAQLKFNEAELAADTERIKAAFDSINTAIESTGDVISDLTSDFLKAESEWDKSFIESMLREEQKRREEAFKLQKELTEAEIEAIKAKTQRLLGGDFLLKVEATSLEQPLEMIFQEILKRAQIRANAEGLEFLVGVA